MIKGQHARAQQRLGVVERDGPEEPKRNLRVCPTPPSQVMKPAAGVGGLVPTLKEALVPFAEAVPWPVIVVDESGLVLHLNAPMRSRGTTLDTADRSFTEMFPEYAAVLFGEVPWLTPQEAAVTRTVRNTQIHERVWVRRLPKGACLIVTDETRARELEVAHAQSARLASLGFMLASVSHEIGNPLAAIHSMLQILQSRQGAAPETTQRGLATIAVSVRRLIAISRKLNIFSRVAAEAPVEISIDAVIDEAAAVFGYDSLGETVELIHHRDPGARLVGQAGELQQVFYNLFLNAAQAMKGEGVITVEVSHSNTAVMVSVRDTGPGIPSDHLQKIFEPFYTTKRKGGSTGLGLAISHEIVQEHHGAIHAEHLPEGGALFHVCLPTRLAEGGTP